MEMRAGYKRTNAGIIPEDWKVNTLGEIGNVRMCKRVLKQQTRSNGDVPFYKIGTFGGVADAYINHSLFEEFKRKYSYPKKGDVLISAAGTIGRSVIFDGSPSYFQDSNIVWIENDESKATNEYLWHCYQVTKWAVSHGGTVARLYNDSLRTRIHVPVPPLSEQRAIAQALSDVDDLITALDLLIAKKRDIKQATMQELLTGKTRLTGFVAPWIKKRFGDISEYVDGEITAGGDEGYVEIGDIDVENKTYNVSQKTKLSVPGAVKVPAGTLLISTVRPTRGAITVTLSAVHVSSAFCRLSPKNGLLFYLASQSTFLAYLGENSFGGTYPTCRDETIQGYETMIPSDPKEQDAIASVLSDMDAELSALESRRDKTRALKQGMMQELLTGKTRLI
jgi:type I restriction enzyme, S subunit